MLLLVSTPYLIILLGVCAAFFEIRPKMFAWATMMLGGLFSLSIGAFLLVSDAIGNWSWALIAIAPSSFLIANIIKDLSRPRINDVTTDLVRPPEFVAAKDAPPNNGRDMSFPPKFGEIIRKGYPDLKPYYTDKPAMDVIEIVRGLMDRQPGWTVTSVDQAKGIVEGEVMTSILRFVDDVIVRVEHTEQMTRVDMRSKSREGLVDGGYNAKRIKVFLERLSRHFD